MIQVVLSVLHILSSLCGETDCQSALRPGRACSSQPLQLIKDVNWGLVFSHHFLAEMHWFQHQHSPKDQKRSLVAFDNLSRQRVFWKGARSGDKSAKFTTLSEWSLSSACIQDSFWMGGRVRCSL